MAMVDLWQLDRFNGLQLPDTVYIRHMNQVNFFVGCAMIVHDEHCCISYSDDTLASFRGPFLVPVDWHQKLISLSYFSGARKRCRIEHVQFRAENQLEN